MLRAWRWWFPPALLALLLTLIYIDPFAGDWDALDYTVLALRHSPSSMLLGRMLFIFSNDALYHLAHALFGLSPDKAYLLFKYAVVVQSPLVIVAFWTLARELSASVRTATVAALMLALSPFFVVYGGQAMTEIPSLLWLTIALTVHLRGLRQKKLWLVLTGAALLGLGVNIREAGALYGLWLVAGPLACGWHIKKRELVWTAAACAIFFALALGPFAWWYWMDYEHYRAAWHNWTDSMRAESALHPVSIKNFVPLFFYFYIAAPLALVALPAAAFKEWRAHKWSPLLASATVGFIANLMLVSHYSVVLNGRYLLTGLPGVIPLASDYLLRFETTRTGNLRRAFWLTAGGVLLIAAIVGGTAYNLASPTFKGHGLTKEYRARLALLPRDAVLIAGAQTVAVTFWRGIGVGEWDVIGTGGGWPQEPLPQAIENYLRNGRRVFLDTDPRVWMPRGWQLVETRAVVALEPRFHFRRVSDSIYEIRPLDDDTARDEPRLQRLLPENRSTEETHRITDAIAK